MATIECPVCGMTYTGKRCPVCGAKVKIRYRQEAEAQSQTQAAPMPEPEVHEVPTQAVPQLKKKSAGKRTAAALMASICVVIAASIVGIAGSFNRVRHSYEEQGYEFVMDPDMTDYEIDPETVYDADGVKVEIQHYLRNDYMTEIHFQMTNDTDHDVRVSSELATIDGVASDRTFYTLVGAHETVDDVIYIFDNDLAEMGLSDVHEFAFQLRVRDDETYEDLDVSERYVFKTPAEGSAQHAVPEGTVVYEKDGIRIRRIGTQSEEEDRFVMRYYVENDSDRDLCIFSQGSLTVNGEEVDSSYAYGPDIPAGSGGFIDVVVYDYTRDVRSLEGTMAIMEKDTWEDIGQLSIEYPYE